MSDVRVLTIHSDAANVTDATTSAVRDRVVGIYSDGFLGAADRGMTLLAAETALSNLASDVTVVNQQNYLPVANPRLLRDGGSFRVRVCHLDAASPLTAGARPVVGDWTLVLRLEMLGSKPRT
eukprot:jgi/Mesvir1/1982/Mv05843-RA.1